MAHVGFDPNIEEQMIGPIENAQLIKVMEGFKGINLKADLIDVTNPESNPEGLNAFLREKYTTNRASMKHKFLTLNHDGGTYFLIFETSGKVEHVSAFGLLNYCLSGVSLLDAGYCEISDDVQALKGEAGSLSLGGRSSYETIRASVAERIGFTVER